MASGFLVLQRFFLRVDGVLVRINDTRLYHAAQTDYLLREYTSKEAKIKDLRVCSESHMHTEAIVLIFFTVAIQYADWSE